MALRNAFGDLNLEITQQAILDELQSQQKNALTNVELRASPINVLIPQPIEVEGAHVVSEGNSTTTPLGANATFTGQWEDVLKYVSIVVLVNSNQLATSDNIRIDFSTDGVNLDRSIPVTFQPGGDYCSFPVQARFFRLRIINGNQAQTFLRAQVQFNTFAESNKLIPLGDTVTNADAALLTKTTIIARSSSGGGTFVDVKASPSGALQTEVTGTVNVTGTVQIAEPVTIDGSVSVLNFPASQVVEVSAPLPVEQDSGEQEFIHVPFTVTNTGDTVVYTPAAGKRIRLRWIYAINDPTAATAPVISVKIGTQEIYRVYALSKRQKVTGPINGQLIINLSVPGNVQVTALIEEI
ncbi:hypothetical protein [Synechococcus phage BUCT-ZZ01]|nr:hypothetical protein [Synechococcus phage BUCT-ZZ01]